MPLYQINNHHSGIRTGTWKIREGKDHLIEESEKRGIDVKPCLDFQSTNRALQWMAARLLLSEMMGGVKVEVVYDKYGKPHLKEGVPHISISHSGYLVAVSINEHDTTGIDVERIDDKIKRISRKFLSEDELSLINPERSTEHLVKLWSAKEAIYKAYGKNELSFKDHIRLNDFVNASQQEVLGYVSKGGPDRHFKLEFQKLDDFVMVYVVNP